ncbi:MAG: outer membrane beta-barrel protein [Pseudolabrys sp.]
MRLIGGTLGLQLPDRHLGLGLEGDVDYSGMKGSSSAFCAPDCTVTNSWLGTARARLGYAGWNNWLPYITGGLAAGNVKVEQAGVSDSKTKLGWTAGLGVEYALFTNWSVRRNISTPISQGDLRGADLQPGRGRLDDLQGEHRPSRRQLPFLSAFPNFRPRTKKPRGKPWGFAF